MRIGKRLTPVVSSSIRCRMITVVPAVLSCLSISLSVCAHSQDPASRTPSSSIVQPIDETNLIEQQGNTVPQARAEYDRGAVADSFPMQHMLLVLKRTPQQEAALKTLIDQLHDPKSTHFHAWLTAEQLGRKFGPLQPDIEVVTNWLRAHGFQVHRVLPNGIFIDFSGNAGQVRDTFRTEIHQYIVNRAQHIANAENPSLPAALTPVVQGVMGLNDFPAQAGPKKVKAIKRDSATGNWTPADPQPVFSFSASNSNWFYVGPQDFLKIYHVTPLWQRAKPITGKGQTIAIISGSDINSADWNTFRSAFGLNSFSGTLSQVHPQGPLPCVDPGIVPGGNEDEAALDTEWSGVAAPDANIELDSCGNLQGVLPGYLIAAINVINRLNPPPIISVSYAVCEAKGGIDFDLGIAGLWQQAAAEGTSVIVGAADGGASGCGGGAADGDPATNGIGVSALASTPYNLAVGGTDFADFLDGTVGSYWRSTNSLTLESAKSYIPEIPWNESCASSVLYKYFGFPDGSSFCNAPGNPWLEMFAGSGGPSAVHPKPAWQSGVLGVPSDGVRGIPDLSLFSSSGFYGHALVWCVSDSTPCVYSNATDALFSSGGGTSFAAPMYAGVQALVNQWTGSRQGNPAYALYGLGKAEYGTNASPDAANLAACNSAASGVDSCIFHDITRGDNNVVCLAGSPNCYAPPSSIYGVLSSSSSSLEVAFPATSGWDFATGLGTINITNLVTNWPK